jgi:hypothetical protein
LFPNLRIGFQGNFLPSGLWNNVLYTFFMFYIWTTYSTHLVLLDLITIIIQYLVKSTNYDAAHYAIFFSLLSYPPSHFQIFFSAQVLKHPHC